MADTLPIIITVSDKDAIAKLNNVKKVITSIGDTATTESVRIQKAFNSAFASINTSSTKMSSTFSSAAASMSSASSRSASNIQSSFSKAATEASSSFSKMSSTAAAQAGKMSTAFNGAMKSIKAPDSLSNLFGSLGGSAAMLGGVTRSLVAGAEAAYGLSNSFFAAENGLKAITGSSDAAKESMAFVSQESDRLGQDILTLSTSYTKLAAAGSKSSLTTAQVRDVFSSLSETATVLQFNAQTTEGAFRALTQMLSKGKVQAEELRGQLGEHLPGAFEIAAEAMGVSTAKLDEMLKKGQVTADMLLTKLPAALRATYGGGLEAALGRSSVQIARMNNEMKTFGASAGTAIEPATAALANLGRSILHMFNNEETMSFFSNIAKSFADLVNKVANNMDLIELSINKAFIGALNFVNFWVAGFKVSIATVSYYVQSWASEFLGAAQTLGVQLASVFDRVFASIKTGYAAILEKVGKGADYVGLDFGKGLIQDAQGLREAAKLTQDAYDQSMEEIVRKNLDTQAKLSKAKDDRIASIYDELDAQKKYNDEYIKGKEASVFAAKEQAKLDPSLSDKNKKPGIIEEGPSAKEAKEALKERNKLLEEGKRLTESLRTPQEEYNATIANLNKLLGEGVISQETYNRAKTKAFEDLNKLSKEAKKEQKDLADQLKSTNKEIETLIDKNATPYEAMQKSLAELNELEAKAAELRKVSSDVLVSDQAIMRERSRIQDEYYAKLVEQNKAFDWNGMLQSGLEGTADILTEYLVDPFNTSTDDIKKKFGDMLRGMASDLLKSAFMRMFTQVFDLQGENKAGGAGGLNALLGPALSTLFGGEAKASGASPVGALASGAGGAVKNIAGAMAGGACSTECAVQAGTQIQQAMTTGAQTTSQSLTTSLSTSTQSFMNSFSQTASNAWDSLGNIFGSATSSFSSVFSGLTDSLSGLFSSLPSMLSGLFGGGGGGIGSMLSSAGSAIGSAFSGMAGAAGGGWGALASTVLSAFAANGKVVEGGRIHAFADGGIVSGPTRFPLASGNTGLMGEAGPEAIMPLTRGPDGKLAVSANGGGGSNVTIINIMDEKLLESYLKSDNAGKVIVNQLSKNSSQVKSIARG